MKNISTSSLALITIFIAIFGAYPYVFGRLLPLPSLNLLYFITSFILICVIIVKRVKIYIPKQFTILCLFQIIIFCLLGLFHSDIFYFNRYILFIIISYLFILAIYNIIGLQKFIYYNNLIVAAQAVLGLVAFILIISGVLHPLFEFSGGGERIAYFYGLTTTNIKVGNFIRVSGFFDEPGALAFWGIFALIFNKLFFTNRRLELILIVSLISTFSMAYYIQIILYFILFYINKKNILIITPFLLVIMLLYNEEKSSNRDSELYYLTFRRFERNDSGKIETNRDELTKNARALFVSSPIIGVGETHAQSIGGVDDNPFETLAKGGILGTFALYLPLFITIVQYRRFDLLKASFILLLGYLQRPFHIQLIHFLMLYIFYLMAWNSFSSKQQIL